MDIDQEKVMKMFEYCSKEKYIVGNSVMAADGAFVFGRADCRVAERTAQLYKNGLIRFAMITGGVGKDSGDLDVSEAEYLGMWLRDECGIKRMPLYLETEASNGGENARFGLDMIAEAECDEEGRRYHNKMIIVAHATSLRRLEATLLQEAGEEPRLSDWEGSQWQRVGTKYPFNPENPVDQKEVVGEMIRMADYPAKGFCVAQPDMDEGLLAYARQLDAYFKEQ